MIHMQITIEQQANGDISIVHSTPAGRATEDEKQVYASLSLAINTMLELQGGQLHVIPITKEMASDPARN